MKKWILTVVVVIFGCNITYSQSGSNSPNPLNPLYKYEGITTRWISFENIHGTKGKGGMENFGAKGHPYDRIEAKKAITLCELQGPGIINRIWLTIDDRSPLMLRGLVLNIYWDNEEKPAVSAPLGDFFGQGLGRTAVFENFLFANPEGRSFNCFIPMPFRQKARMEIVNETNQTLDQIYYDVNIQLLEEWEDDNLYFHCYWHRDKTTKLAEDFEILPPVNGLGRFLGTNISLRANPAYDTSWWGEGEVKIFLDGDGQYATLVGTGTEDYIGTGWGQGKYATMYSGSLIADYEGQQWNFYRYHIPDPIYFKTDCRVTIQQIGGGMIELISKLQKEGVDLIPITYQHDQTFQPIYQPDSIVNVDDLGVEYAWVNFYRSDDVAAVAYFYLNKPANDLPSLQPLMDRL